MLFILLIIVVSVLTILPLLLYGYFWQSYRYWANRKVPYLEPVFPRGNLKKILSMNRGYNLEFWRFYNKMKANQWDYGGVYTINTPVLVIVKPELAKLVLVKDFNYFVDRGFYTNSEEMMSLFTSDEDHWRVRRMHLTPTFTSQKTKMMYPLMIKTSDSLINAMGDLVDQKQDIDMSEFVSKFTTDVIVSCAFGLEANSFSTDKQIFRDIGKHGMEEFSFLWSVKTTIMNYHPDLAGKLGLEHMKEDVKKFFIDTVAETVNYRKTNNVTRPDFLQMCIDMMENTKDTDDPFTFHTLVSEVHSFFVAGFDTSSAVITLGLYELAQHHDIQERLRKEIHEAMRNNNNKIDYETLLEMKYLNQVVDETLRKYPSVPIVQRRCVRDYYLEDTLIEKGTQVVVSIIGIHRDPEYYPDPLKYDPERFSSKNRANIGSSTFIPFSMGPRNCIGLRFGLLQVKIALTQILNNFRISISPRMKMPIELDEDVFLMKTKGPLYLKAERL
uniref:Cytochrome P450 n=1 Tax=Agasicles hygrophila TaxID=715812 RepID=A0A3S6FEQ0_9CUCU|nr:cytochrome P450 [Agasicles hygrophila]AZR39436.1 cytochrome P450 [Agasicles hygrophila]